MVYACLILLLQAAGAQPPPPPPTAPPPPAATEQPTTAPTYDEGPLRAEVFALGDRRYWFSEAMPNAPKSDLVMTIRVRGEGITDLVRSSASMIVDEAVDDTGKSLFTKTYTPEERDATRPVTAPADRIRSSGWQLNVQLESPARTAKLVKLRGIARLVFAKDKQEITVDNPLQYVGKTIDNPQLRELGIEVRIVPNEELKEEGPEPLPGSAKLLAFQYVTGGERVQSVTFHDGNMKALRSRDRPMQTKSGQAVAAQQLSGVDLTEDCQAVFLVFPKIDDKRLPIQLEIPLP